MNETEVVSGFLSALSLESWVVQVFVVVLAIVDRHGAEIAFPTSTVHVPGEISIADRASGSTDAQGG